MVLDSVIVVLIDTAVGLGMGLGGSFVGIVCVVVAEAVNNR